MRVGGYVRLSRDEDKENYSSILSQKKIIEEFAIQHNWTIDKYYEDDNCSGYSFDRPAFNEMIRDLEKDCIDVIIAKDLSRIGRHNAYTLLFLEKIKKLSKRLLLPGEGQGYDTMADESDLLGITTWYNEMYIKDISRKIKSSIKARQKAGRLIIKEAFGYKRSIEDKHRLEIDPEAADIVQSIFQLYLSGIGYRKIAERLNQEGYPTPSKYHALKSAARASKLAEAKEWNSVHVQRIIKNDLYTGSMRLGKTEKKHIKGKSQKQPVERQYIFENSHPPIISMQQFEEARLLSETRKISGQKGAASLQNLFSGFLYCQDCGSYMIAYNKKAKAKSYICGCYHKKGVKGCSRHTIMESVLLEAVLTFLTRIADSYERQITAIQLNRERSSGELQRILVKSLIQEQQQSRERLKQLILQKTVSLAGAEDPVYQGILLESYEELEQDIKQRLLHLSKRVKELEEKETSFTAANELEPFHLLKKTIEEKKLDKKKLEIFLDKILIDGNGNPTIYMKVNFDTICMHNREAVN